jgi:hypothetical protein
VPLVESLATAAAAKAVTLAVQEGVQIGTQRREREKATAAFAEILQHAYLSFEKEYPSWTTSLFDGSFLETEAASYLGLMLVPSATVSATDLATAWADSIALSDGEGRVARIRELEGPAAAFLDSVRAGVERNPLFRDLVNDSVSQEIARQLTEIASALGAGTASPGTRLDYLRWLGGRYSHIDPRGIPQTERQVQVPLDQVYVGLTADDAFEQSAPGAGRRTGSSEAVDLDARW